jgi:hypothetical protein
LYFFFRQAGDIEADTKTTIGEQRGNEGLRAVKQLKNPWRDEQVMIILLRMKK